MRGWAGLRPHKAVAKWRKRRMAEKKWKRKKLVVDKEFQFRYLMTWVLLTMSLLGGLVIGSLSVFWYFKSEVMLTYFIWVNGLCAVVITGASVYYIILHSHRIAGPAFRLERLIKEMAEGRRGFRVRLRQKDYLKQLATALNELLESLEKREARVRELGVMVGGLSNNGHDIAEVHDVAGKVSREIAVLCPEVSEVLEDGTE